MPAAGARMSGSAAWAFPTDAILAGWWRQLSPLEPSAWWVGHLFCHRVEALVEVSEARALDPLEKLLLTALPEPAGSHARAPAPLLGGLAPVLYRRLAELGLVQRNGSGSWLLTEAG